MAYIAEHASGTSRGKATSSSAAFLLVKNLLFWGSMGLTGAALYFMASLAVG